MEEQAEPNGRPRRARKRRHGGGLGGNRITSESLRYSIYGEVYTSDHLEPSWQLLISLIADFMSSWGDF